MELIKNSKNNGPSFVTFPKLDNTGIVRHGFALRTGGCSTGCYDSLNLSYTMGDEKAKVDENFDRVAAFFGTDKDRIISVYQTHTSTVLRVGAAEAGAGITKERLYPDADGIMTNEPGLLLTTSHADCTPLFFVDPVHKAIAMTHSGWRGTVGGIGRVTVEKMKTEFGTKPEEIVAAIGPCICGDCYEVGPDVADPFIEKYGDEVFEAVYPTGPILKKKDNGKYLFNQKAANAAILCEAGIRAGNISISELCTYERSDYFFSHRKMGSARGNLRAFLMLEENI